MPDEEDEDADVPDSPISLSPYSLSPAPGISAYPSGMPPRPPDPATAVWSGSRMAPLSQHTRERVSSMGSMVSKRDGTQREREREMEKETILWSRWDKARNR
jgi:hypothetical protein